jgi:sugar lactone lactonase YvrE
MRGLALSRPLAAVPLLAAAMVITLTAPASASRSDEVIVLPGATSAEGIAAGRGNTFYAGDLFGGDIFLGDIRRGTAERFIDVPDGRQSVGMTFVARHDLLFVAGGPGRGYVYNTRTRTSVAAYDFADPAASFVNDVAVTPFGAYFTDSSAAQLYFVPVRHGVPGAFRTLALSGPAADLSADFNLNGIQATSSGRTLIVAHSGLGKLFTVNPVTGESAEIAGVSVPNVDGIVLDGHRLWAVQNFANQISRFRLSGDFSRGVLEKVITSDAYQIPTTAALFGHRLAAVNSHFDTGVPPTAPQYEVVVTES